MISRYVTRALEHADYRVIDDGTFAATVQRVARCRGNWKHPRGLSPGLGGGRRGVGARACRTGPPRSDAGRRDGQSAPRELMPAWGPIKRRDLLHREPENAARPLAQYVRPFPALPPPAARIRCGARASFRVRRDAASIGQRGAPRSGRRTASMRYGSNAVTDTSSMASPPRCTLASVSRWNRNRIVLPKKSLTSVRYLPQPPASWMVITGLPMFATMSAPSHSHNFRVRPAPPTS